ncbi:hypothetical protein BO86DRAFT_69736 [Aspergillus japonicus CBS 114.51]|uniref:Uncharacterized protein n=1 Tax=Aspergillus japonicus CBS 114.51 TaxID=1448312 RepID=A0A8T8X3I1_ASPJA|nr:hypothetical protein BO86DRAFT_69736 [Aspergillus japonicus CBS 114.51]RAH82504.1 hypothetical protein BO86DRAFT_69736 [Aspergillus japonicus CBS 114.51]
MQQHTSVVFSLVARGATGNIAALQINSLPGQRKNRIHCSSPLPTFPVFPCFVSAQSLGQGGDDCRLDSSTTGSEWIFVRSSALVLSASGSGARRNTGCMEVCSLVGLFPFLLTGSPGPLKSPRLDEAKVYLG